MPGRLGGRGSSAEGGTGTPPAKAWSRSPAVQRHSPNSPDRTPQPEAGPGPGLVRAATSFHTKFGRQTAENLMRTLDFNAKVRLKVPEEAKEEKEATK